jgi:iron complex outermembrane recepter protein
MLQPKRSPANTGMTTRWFVRAAIAAGVALTRAAVAQNATEGPAAPTASASEPTTDVLQEVVVTGTLIRGAQPPGSELVTVDRAAIEATGATSTTNLMTKLPTLSSFGGQPTGTTDFANPVPQFNIRASGGTLVLVNGHRLVGSGILQTTPDPSVIPVSVIERVEVLPDGASATYGADAVDGVVNFILRDHFDGAETRASYGSGSDYHEYDLSQLVGKSWNTGGVMASFEYTSHGDFSYGSRSFYTNNLTAEGGKNHFVTTCSPPNVTVNGVNYAGPSFAPGTNTCDPNAYADLIPYQKRSTWFLAGHQSLTDSIELRGDAFYSSNGQASKQAQSVANPFNINNTNPFFQAPPGTNATSEQVGYWFINEFGPTNRSQVDWNTLGVDLTLSVKLGHDWQAKLTGNYGKNTTYARTPAVDGGVLNTAATATTTATAFDPFTGKTSPTVLAALRGGGVAYRAEQGLHDGELDFDGPLFTLPGGEVRLAVGGEIRTESLDGVPYTLSNGLLTDIVGGPQSASRRDTAEYLELFIPIVGTGNAMTGMQKLVLSLAGRHDDYSDFGSTTNPKFALDYKPIDALTLRGSASNSFQAPSLADMRSVDTRLQTLPIAPFTPTGFQPVPEIFLAGGSPTLQPQSAHTYSFGFEVQPQSSGFDAGATYWHSHISKQINLAFPTVVPLFTNPAFKSLWWGPGGQPLTQAVLNQLLSLYRVDQSGAAFTQAYQQALVNGGYILDLRRKNLGTTTMDGIDFHVNYNWQSGFGDWTASLAGTRELQRLNIPGPGAPEVNLTATDPRLQFRAALEWTKEQWSAGINENYISPYNVTGVDVPVYQVATYMTTDVRLTYHIDESAGRILGKTDITLKADNLLDRNPPFLLGGNGFNGGPVGAPHANPIGRLVSVMLVKRW